MGRQESHVAVSSHLKIALDEYDARIRTFIPNYEEMLAAAADALVTLAGTPETVVDLGIGTGALAAAVAAAAPKAALVGIDEDEGMLGMASRRLPGRALTLVPGNFTRAPLPRADGITASLSLHHIRSRRTRAALFARARHALRPRGAFVTADCHPAANAALAAAGHEAWRDHLAVHYGRRKAGAFLEAWSHEDFYVPLDTELRLLREAGFSPDVAWRRGAFAVIAARPRRA
ncbi:MAG: class I SAM-dependent methyltransferase [Vicinamibacterales bacterium]